MAIILVWHSKRSAMKSITKNKLVSLLLIISFILLSGLPEINVNASGSRFTDIESSQWYFEPVIQLYGMNIIDGYPDNTFKPEGNVKTDELIKMIIKALGFDIQNSKDYWAQNYIDKAEEIGMLEGFDAVYTKDINRGQAAVLISNAMTYLKEPEYNTEEVYPFDLGMYTPVEYIQHIKKCFSAGIINGFEDFTFRYKETLTRAQACTLVIKVMDKSKRDISVRPDCSFLENTTEDNIKYVGVEFDELSDSIKHTLLQVKDDISYTVVEKRVYETKNTYEIRYHKSSLYSNPSYCMFALRFFEGETGYPEKQWGYDTMFLKLELKSLDWEDGIPVSYYKSKVKNAICAALSEYNPYDIADYIMKKYDFIRSLDTHDAYNLLEDNSNDELRYVFFTMENVIGNFTFSSK